MPHWSVGARHLWWGLLVAVGGVTALAFTPPVLGPEGRAVVMHLFSPVCHQLPGRSPMMGDVPLALCDRCTGIYLGAVLGVMVGGWAPVWRGRLPVSSRVLLLGSLVPLALDWVGPILGLWPNGPWSRAATGLLFGGVAASMTVDRLLRTARGAGDDGRRGA